MKAGAVERLGSVHDRDVAGGVWEGGVENAAVLGRGGWFVACGQVVEGSLATAGGGGGEEEEGSETAQLHGGGRG